MSKCTANMRRTYYVLVPLKRFIIQWCKLFKEIWSFMIDYEPHEKAQCHSMGDRESYFRSTSAWPNQDREKLKTNQGYRYNSMYRKVGLWGTLGTKTPNYWKSAALLADLQSDGLQGKPLDLAQRKTVRLEIIAGGVYLEVKVLDKGKGSNLQTYI